MRKLLAVFAFLSSASRIYADVIPVTGWVVHNGTSTISGTADTPIFTAGDNITIMAPFADVMLANDGDFIEGQTTLTMNTRTGTGINTLNTQLRVGLFDDSVNSSVTANDTPNIGFILEYTNVAAGGLIREQTNSPSQTNPFTSPLNIGNGAQDSGADSLQGANPGPVTFDLKLTRNAGKIDLLGSISGTDAVSGHAYLQNYSVLGYTPVGGEFTFNRLALFIGDGVNAASASVSSSSITTPSAVVVPEPISIALFAPGMIGLLARRRRKQGGVN